MYDFIENIDCNSGDVIYKVPTEGLFCNTEPDIIHSLHFSYFFW